MRNILLVANWDSDVGYAWWLMESFWVEIASHYAQSDCDIFLIFPSISKIPQSIQDSNIITREIKFSCSTSAEKAKLKEFIKNNNIGFVYLSDRPSISSLYTKLYFWGVEKIVIHDHTPGDREAPTGMKKLLKAIFHRIPLITADLYIGATEYIKERNIRVNQLPQSKCVAAPNGIVPIVIDEGNRDKYRQELGIADDAIVCISTGRAHRYKGIDFLIRCAEKIVKQQAPNEIYFLHCGDGPHLDDFRDLAKELGVSEKFIFLGRRNDVRELLQACDIALHAAQGEVGYSLSILEYMSAGLATFVPDRLSVCQSIEHDKTGIIYQANSQDDLCKNVCALIDDRKKMLLLAENAKLEVMNKYSLDLTKKALIKGICAVF